MERSAGFGRKYCRWHVFYRLFVVLDVWFCTYKIIIRSQMHSPGKLKITTDANWLALKEAMRGSTDGMQRFKIDEFKYVLWWSYTIGSLAGHNAICAAGFIQKIMNTIEI